METGRLRWVNRIVIIVLFAVLSSCYHTPQSGLIFDVSVVENGDIICRHGNGMFSNFFRNTSLKEQLYSHTGIISKVGDSVFVIHSEASEFSGIGGVKQEFLSSYLNNVSTYAIYRLDTIPEVRDSIVSLATEYVSCCVPFDFAFDYTSDDKIYCTELIAITVNKAMGREVIVPTGDFNGLTYYAIDDTYLIEPMKLIMKKEKGD